ncbi:polysaccharide deacetylase WbmS family protein [Capnocytophaga stomatis]|uniref:NodB homology domain-containing protein n=1 Tax=Capnocytophaga stomatis TaxID=1848904 RepID=A0A250FZH8_9FLAO|nr:hypothetical protein [Capnocytophaga stomatis]ATA90463.1 hypothetical protein CGC58_12395 [Capnocytophaga stomatis]GIJ94084.1 hypothetical protein CAPN002_13020 [Capnocytophaga stomatis]GIJ97640.1 hypothetical protein CAPN001_22090 [Capnocytophaga stomatis]GIM49469.1 hypothetical protein CAPN003_09210 [Capnocytophaga stomatis]
MSDLKFAFTIDLDWASEAVIEYALLPVLEDNIPLTIFSTHNSEWLISRSINNHNIELEIHPNFCLNSSHGSTYDEVFNYCNQLQTEKKGFRCHRYFEVNEINEYYKSEGYKYSSNICTDLHYIQPFYNRVGLLSIPLFMEDGGFLLQKHSLSLETILKRLPEKGTIVFLFHPMHLAFNSNNFHTMKNLKKSISIEEYQNISIETIKKNKNNFYGINHLLWELIKWSKENMIECVLLKSLINEK